MLIPAKYAPYIRHALDRAIAEARLDEDFRSDTDPRIQRFASVPDSLIDETASGEAAFAIVQEAA